MKRGIGCVGMLILWAAAAPAQTKGKVAETGKPATATVQMVPPVQVPAGMYSLTTWGQYQAKRNAKPDMATLSITDPTVRTLHLRAQGAPVAWDSKEILGVPKVVYGFANGQILFRSRGATTSGTGTGSGTVGTGSSPGPLGINGLSLGVNGKSPDAGPIMDGIIVTDINDNRLFMPPPRDKRTTTPRRQRQ